MFLILGVPSAFAAIGDITCTAHQWEMTENGTKDDITIKLDEHRIGPSIRFSGVIGGRAYSLIGDTQWGDFMLTQSEAPDWTVGLNATAAFTPSGRMQISQVIGVKVFKLECLKQMK